MVGFARRRGAGVVQRVALFARSQVIISAMNLCDQQCKARLQARG